MIELKYIQEKTKLISIVNEYYLFRFFQNQFNNLKLERCQEIRKIGICESKCFINNQWLENCLNCGFQTRKSKKDDKLIFR